VREVFQGKDLKKPFRPIYVVASLKEQVGGGGGNQTAILQGRCGGFRKASTPKRGPAERESKSAKGDTRVTGGVSAWKMFPRKGGEGELTL